MRRLIVSLALALVTLGAAAGGVGATHSNGEGPKQDLAAGEGHIVLPERGFRVSMQVNALGGRLGLDPHGHFFVKREGGTLTPIDLDFSGRVTCLQVVGNTAIVGGVITRDKLGAGHPLSPFEGRGYQGVYVDNGDSGPPDMSNSTIVPSPPPAGPTCPYTGPPPVPFPEGNYVVHDATP